ncbi:hypothetical protein V5H98_12855 [Georgenia sp. M64]|jgi:hypothetical protein|uniref:hypothetical protein n=1 Tax=Georgenia sp. M64 TaxID=3120520 RepID=UPI0030E29025
MAEDAGEGAAEMAVGLREAVGVALDPTEPLFGYDSSARFLEEFLEPFLSVLQAPGPVQG